MILKYLKKTNKSISILVEIVVVLGLLTGCNNKQSLEDIIKYESESGVKYNNLFHGLYFGMPMDNFYDHCFQMNQKGVFFQNGLNVEVIVKYENEFSAPVDFVFFPQGTYQSIERIDGSFMFQHWSPFSKEYRASGLIEELVEKMQDWYPGRDFVRIDHPKALWPYAYAKVDGNRKIVLYQSFDDQKVHVTYENLDVLELHE